MELTNKVAIVTGGGQGLGEAICRALSRAGVTVVVADIQAEKAQKVADNIKQEGCAGSTVMMDVSREDSVKQAVEQVMQQYGHIDILVNNAGIDYTLPFDELTVEQFDRVLDVNLRGPFLTARHIIPIMYRQNEGHIVNIASTAARRMWPNAAAYHASKWGLVGLSHALFTEARQHGVKVSTIIAGGMRTPFILDRFPDTPLSNLQDPKHVADTIVFLLQQPTETIIPEVMVVPLNETSWP
ncbi:MAG: SDR family oxidoreductase [Chloroflexi bacterium]|nr:SDR family oxidoreductase [Chloroflexota bacterium]